MSDIRIANIPLQQLFDNKRGNSELTKKYCNLHKGEYLVYTGTTIGDFAKIDTYAYDSPNLTYTTDGVNAGTVGILSGKYNVGGHRAILIPKSDELLLEYFEDILQPIFKNLIKNGNVPSVTWVKIKNEEVVFFFKQKTAYEMDGQKKIAERYKGLNEKKSKLQEYLEQLTESYIQISTDGYNYKEVPLNELFEYKRGRSCTKTYCNQHKGKNPVWSANNLEPLAYVDFYDYDGKYISLSRNGIAGKITILDGKFTINEDRFLLIPKYKNIDYNYIKFTVEPILRSKKKGRAGHSGQNEFTKLSFTILDGVKIKMPIKEDGTYDLDAQNAISKKYIKLYEIKDGIQEKLKKVISSNISLKE